MLKLEKWLASAEPGGTALILATDGMAKVDIPLHCRQNGHACELDERDGTLRFTVTAASR